MRQKLAGTVAGYDDADYPDLLTKARTVFAGQTNRAWLSWGRELMLELKALVESEEADVREAEEREAKEAEERNAQVQKLLDDLLHEKITSEEFQRKTKAIEGGEENETAKGGNIGGSKAKAGDEKMNAGGAEKTTKGGNEKGKKEAKEGGAGEKKTGDGEKAGRSGRGYTNGMKPVVEIRTGSRRKRGVETEKDEEKEDEEDSEVEDAEAERKWGKAVEQKDGVSALRSPRHAANPDLFLFLFYFILFFL
jgi:hypothetical protein